MSENPSGFESAINELRAAVVRLEERVAHVESQMAAGPAPAMDTPLSSAAAPAPAAPPIGRDWRDPIAVLSLLGRLFIVLGGAYLLRAMADTGAVPPLAGVALGLTYGLVWLAMADRSSARGRVPSAVFHGIGAAMVAFPVVLEATTRFRVLPGAVSAGVLAAVTGGLLIVAWRSRVQAFAWIAVVTAIPTSILILAQTGSVVPHAVFLILFGIAALWLGYSLDWFLVRWPVAIAADLVVLGVTMRALASPPQEGPGVAIAVQVALLGAYLASIAVRTLVRGRNVVPFEVVQTTAALAVGLGGALSVTQATGSGGAMLGGASLALGAACYGVAFAFLAHQQARGRNVYFYTSLGIVLVLVGVWSLLPAARVTAVLATLALACAAAWPRAGRLFLLIHAAIYVVAAAAACGSAVYGVRALVAGAAEPWPLPTAAMAGVLAASAVSAWLASRGPANGVFPYASAPRFIVVLILVLSAGGTLVGYVVPALATGPGGSIDPGILATVRTCVLAASTLLVAWIGRHARFREWSWLVYPLLVGTGIKMVTQDFPRSRPGTLFVALALYGSALIVAPRLRSRQA
jgi:hypothetical protein